MATRNVSIPAAAWIPTADAAGFASAALQIKQSSVAVPSPRWPEWLFSTAAIEYIVTGFHVPQNYIGAPTLNVFYKMTTAVANEITWGVRVAVADTASGDMDAQAFVSTGSIATVTVPSTAGDVEIASISISTDDGADQIGAGDFIVLSLYRDPTVPTSDADSGAEFIGADFRYSDA